MDKKYTICLFVVMLTGCCPFLHAQNQKAADAYAERTAAYINNEFLITGETLYYTVYCLDPQTKKFSSLSKLAYVELIAENEQPVWQSKIPLVDGKGSGDFFLPSTLASGNYTFIAYTKWMRNFPLENFFQKQIAIVNPYLKSVVEKREQAGTPVTSFDSFSQPGSESNRVRFSIPQKNFGHRQKVVVALTNTDPDSACSVSLNVRGYNKMNQVSFASPETLKPEWSQDRFTFLPDLRGETISGLVRERSSGQPVANTEIYLSLPGSAVFFQASKTDAVGKFYFSAKNGHTQSGLRFQVNRLSEDPLIDVILDSEFIEDHKKFRPRPFSIDTTFRKDIERRNVYSQIDNAYFQKKRDSVLSSVQEPFFGKPDKIYKLDDFTRFSTMEDIFREFIYEVFVLKRNEKFLLRLVNSKSGTGSRFGDTPLMLIDGVRIFDTATLMNYNPLLVETISLVTRSYVYAGTSFDGILSMNTYTGLAKDLPVPLIQKEHTPWQPGKHYYSPVYQPTQSLERIPDFRFQLFWNPVIKIEPGETINVEFYTSDVDGDFLVEANGFDSRGATVKLNDVIRVR